MRKITVSVIAFVVLVAAGAAFAQVRGKGRLQGVVTDAATSKPVEGATVTISMADGNTQPIVVKTNAKGRWSALGLTTGQWVRRHRGRGLRHEPRLGQRERGPDAAADRDATAG
jgi:hypothetical protein